MSKKLVGSERKLKLRGRSNDLGKPFADAAAAVSAGFKLRGSFFKPLPKPNKGGLPTKPHGRKGCAAAEEELQPEGFRPPAVAEKFPSEGAPVSSRRGYCVHHRFKASAFAAVAVALTPLFLFSGLNLSSGRLCL
jgi:hypothetical protein